MNVMIAAGSIVKETGMNILVEVAVEAVVVVEEAEGMVATTRVVGETGTKTAIGAVLSRMNSVALSVGVVGSSTAMIVMATKMVLVAMAVPGPLRATAHLQPTTMGRRRRPPPRSVVRVYPNQPCVDSSTGCG